MSRLRKSKIIQGVGKERFLEAHGRLNQLDGKDSLRDARSVIYSVVSRLEESQAPNARVLYLLLSFFEDLPDYRFMMGVKMQFSTYNDEEKHSFWQWARNILESGNDAQKEAFAYALWVDFFEDPQTVDEAWQALLFPLPNEKALQTILIYSGPVPWEQKWSLFLDLQNRTDMHYYIFRSILHSQFDVYGKIDQHEALQTLSKLSIPSDTKYLAKLQSKLKKGVSYE